MFVAHAPWTTPTAFHAQSTMLISLSVRPTSFAADITPVAAPAKFVVVVKYFVFARYQSFSLLSKPMPNFTSTFDTGLMPPTVMRYAALFGMPLLMCTPPLSC